MIDGLLFPYLVLAAVARCQAEGIGEDAWAVIEALRAGGIQVEYGDIVNTLARLHRVGMIEAEPEIRERELRGLARLRLTPSGARRLEFGL